MSGSYVFHGSSVRIQGELRPSPTSRVNGAGREIYAETSLHATPLLYVSLSYLATAHPNFSHGVDLYRAENAIYVYGPAHMSKAALFDANYGRGGYVYLLPTDAFSSIAGLGPLELVSLKPVQPLARVHLSAVELLTLLRLLGTRVIHG